MRSLLASVVILAAFMPYLAIPVGSNSHVPICVIAAAIWLATSRLTAPSLRVSYFLLAPMISVFAGVLMFVPQAPSAILGSLLFTLWAIPIFAVYDMMRTSYFEVVVRALKFGLAVSALFAVWQSFKIGQGVIPFAEMYDLAGYPQAQGTGSGGVYSTQRPYGWFPEPSFLAGSLCLGVAALLSCEKATKDKLSKATWIILLVCVVVGVQTRSGVFIACICPLTVFALSSKQMGRRALVLTLIPAVGAYTALQVYQSRVSEAQWSWGDRWASTYGALRYAFLDARTALVGLGRDSSAYLFSQNKIPVLDLDPTYLPRGVYSITVRYIAEGGIVFGLVPLLLLTLLAYRSLRQHLSVIQALCATITALVVPTLAISYDTASLVWITIGVFVGVPFINSSTIEAKYWSGRDQPKEVWV
ncbi:hypothetical protein [Rhodococcus sp. RS1C4]|nr:hypothetical protein [Rhodococcus sp. RS1C4]